MISLFWTAVRIKRMHILNMAVWSNYKRYRTEMVEWLKDLQNHDDNRTVVFSHSREICIEEDLSESALSKLISLNASILISGHEHICEFDRSGNIPTLVDGGLGRKRNEYLCRIIDKTLSGSYRDNLCG